MRAFLAKSSLFVFLFLGIVLIIFHKADGNFDPFYMRFTTPKQSSLILGTSKAAQGLKPSVLNRELNRNDVYNYSFTLRLSPYGPTYLKSIKRKLKESSNKGIFILTVDPWSIFADSKTPNDLKTFEEKSKFLNFIKSTDKKPNYSYLINGYEDMYIKILYNKSLMFLHSDGWLEVHIDNFKNKKNRKKPNHRSLYFDSLRHKRHIDASINRYLKKKATYNFSEIRIKYLKKTIQELKLKGDVFLVRLPVHEDMIEIENSIMSNFNDEMEKISNEFEIDYFNLTYLNSKCIFNDANHLNRESAAYVSKELAKMINQE